MMVAMDEMTLKLMCDKEYVLERLARFVRRRGRRWFYGRSSA